MLVIYDCFLTDVGLFYLSTKYTGFFFLQVFRNDCTQSQLLYSVVCFIPLNNEKSSTKRLLNKVSTIFAKLRE